MKFIIFSDIYGTILSSYSHFLQETENDIIEAQQKGIEFIVVTSAPYSKIVRNLIKKLHLNYFIGLNGSYIYDVQKEQEIFFNFFQIDTLKKFYNLSQEFDVQLFLKNNDILLKKFQIDWIKENTINQIYFEGAKVKIDALLKLFSKDKKINFFRVNTNQLILSPNNFISKGKAVAHMLKKLKCLPENTMSIGDSVNDISMFKEAEFSYAMANADEKTIKEAKYHTSSVEQNGLGEAIKDFIFRLKI